MDTFLLESVVCRYHVYKEIWVSVLDKELQFIRVKSGIFMICTLSKTGTGTVGHLPKEISSLAISIRCMIAGIRQYSINLSQDTLQVDDWKLVEKINSSCVKSFLFHLLVV